MARPPKEVNWAEVERRLEAGNSARVIAGVNHLDINTFYDKFKKHYGCSFQDYACKYGNFRDQGKQNIAFMQYMQALKGSSNMLTLLGREWLGQGKETVTDKENLANLLKLISDGKIKQEINVDPIAEVASEQPVSDS